MTRCASQTSYGKPRVTRPGEERGLWSLVPYPQRHHQLERAAPPDGRRVYYGEEEPSGQEFAVQNGCFGHLASNALRRHFGLRSVAWILGATEPRYPCRDAIKNVSHLRSDQRQAINAAMSMMALEMVASMCFTLAVHQVDY